MIRLSPFAFALLIAASVATTAPPEAPATPAKKSAAAAKATPKAELPPIFDAEADGDLTLQHYWDVCRRSNRRCIVFFGNNDCDSCRIIASAIFERRFYTELLKQLVPSFVNVEPGSASAEMPTRYGIDPKAPLPGVVIFDPKGAVMETLTKGEMDAVAKKGKEAVQLWLIDRFDRSKPD
jgi:hypothetical protein